MSRGGTIISGAEVRKALDAGEPQLMVFVEAWALYRERNRLHAGVWREAGWRGVLVDMMKKMYRLWWRFWKGEMKPEGKALDDAFDLLNYGAFFIRLAREREEKGSWPW